VPRRERRTRRPSATSATKKVLHPAFDSCARDRLEAAAITVALTTAAHSTGTVVLGEHLPIGLDGGKIDGEKTTRFRRVGGIGRRIGGRKSGS
jgi:hypothetical protein